MINPDPKMIAQLDVLSALIGSNTGGNSSKSGVIKLSLFDENDDDDDDIPRPSARTEQRSKPTVSRPRNEDVTIDASKVNVCFLFVHFVESNFGF